MSTPSQPVTPPQRALRVKNTGLTTLPAKQFIAVSQTTGDLVATGVNTITISGPSETQAYGVLRWPVAAGSVGVLDMDGPAEVEVTFDATTVYDRKPVAIAVTLGVCRPEPSGYLPLVPIPSTQQADGTWRLTETVTKTVPILLGSQYRQRAANSQEWAVIAWRVSTSNADQSIAEICEADGTRTGVLVWIDAAKSTIRSIPDRDNMLYAIADTGTTISRVQPWAGGVSTSLPLYTATGPARKTGGSVAGTDPIDATITINSGYAETGSTRVVGGNTVTEAFPIIPPTRSAGGSIVSGKPFRVGRLTVPSDAQQSAATPIYRRQRSGIGAAAVTDVASVLRFHTVVPWATDSSTPGNRRAGLLDIALACEVDNTGTLQLSATADGASAYFSGTSAADFMNTAYAAKTGVTAGGVLGAGDPQTATGTISLSTTNATADLTLGGNRTLRVTAKYTTLGFVSVTLSLTGATTNDSPKWVGTIPASTTWTETAVTPSTIDPA